MTQPQTDPDPPVLALGQAHVTPEKAARLLHDYHGLTVLDLQRREAEAATVYRVDAEEGRFAVKIAAVPDSRGVEAMRWQTAYAEHLRDRGVPAVRALPDATGEPVTLLPGLLTMQLFEWCEAPSLLSLSEAAPERAGEFRTLVAELAARISLASADAPPAPLDFTHPWDARSFARTARERCPGLQETGLLPAGVPERLAALAAEAEEAIARAGGLPRSAVHQDLHSGNILLNETGERAVCVLDFGDAVPGVRAAEFAVAAAYQLRAAEDPAAALREMTETYARIAPLDAAERRALPALCTARRAVGLVMFADMTVRTASRERARRELAELPGLLERVERDAAACEA